MNHYVTSDRFLDHRVKLYPPMMRGGNGRQAYADTEAVRMDLDLQLLGWEPRLREVWERYGRAIALTEVHLGCDDAREQVQWLLEAWQAASTLRGQGVDVRAVTCWALFGLVDWHVLLREQLGRHEPGALDVLRADPSAGLLARAIAALAGGGMVPAVGGSGWWRRDERLTSGRRTG